MRGELRVELAKLRADIGYLREEQTEAADDRKEMKASMRQLELTVRHLADEILRFRTGLRVGWQLALVVAAAGTLVIRAWEQIRTFLKGLIA